MSSKTTDAVRLRVATPADSEALRAIYAPYVTDTACSFEYTVPGEEEFRRRMLDILPVYPYLVAEQGGRIIGYAYAHRHAERAAFDWNAELSIYLAPDACRQGIGSRLYAALMRLLTEQGLYHVYALVSSPNPASEALHVRCGFHLAGNWRRTGYKSGAWHDLLLYEKDLRPMVMEAPAPITPFPLLPARSLTEALDCP